MTTASQTLRHEVSPYGLPYFGEKYGVEISE